MMGSYVNVGHIEYVNIIIDINVGIVFFKH